MDSLTLLLLIITVSSVIYVYIALSQKETFVEQDNKGQFIQNVKNICKSIYDYTDDHEKPQVNHTIHTMLHENDLKSIDDIKSLLEAKRKQYNSIDESDSVNRKNMETSIKVLEQLVKIHNTTIDAHKDSYYDETSKLRNTIQQLESKIQDGNNNELDNYIRELQSKVNSLESEEIATNNYQSLEDSTNLYRPPTTNASAAKSITSTLRPASNNTNMPTTVMPTVASVTTGAPIGSTTTTISSHLKQYSGWKLQAISKDGTNSSLSKYNIEGDKEQIIINDNEGTIEIKQPRETGEVRVSIIFDDSTDFRVVFFETTTFDYLTVFKDNDDESYIVYHNSELKEGNIIKNIKKIKWDGLVSNNSPPTTLPPTTLPPTTLPPTTLPPTTLPPTTLPPTTTKTTVQSNEKAGYEYLGEGWCAGGDPPIDNLTQGYTIQGKLGETNMEDKCKEKCYNDKNCIGLTYYGFDSPSCDIHMDNDLVSLKPGENILSQRQSKQISTIFPRQNTKCYKKNLSENNTTRPPNTTMPSTKDYETFNYSTCNWSSPNNPNNFIIEKNEDFNDTVLKCKNKCNNNSQCKAYEIQITNYTSKQYDNKTNKPIFSDNDTTSRCNLYKEIQKSNTHMRNIFCNKKNKDAQAPNKITLPPTTTTTTTLPPTTTKTKATVESNTMNKYDFIGNGLCNGGDGMYSHVEGYVKSHSSMDECKKECSNDKNCIGFTYYEEGKRCYIHMPFENVPLGKTKMNEIFSTKKTITGSNGSSIYKCYKKL